MSWKAGWPVKQIPRNRVSARAKHIALGWNPATRSTGSPEIPYDPQSSGVPHDVHVRDDSECPNDRGFPGKYTRSWGA
jgi:hypothetical protein